MRISVKILLTCLILTIFSCTKKDKKTEIQVLQVIPPECAKITDSIIVDSNFSFEEAVMGTKAPNAIINQLQLLNVLYYSTDNKVHKGQLLVNKLIAKDIQDIFEFIYQSHFPIARAIPIVKYNWNDNASMQDNNTYCFCYRNVTYSKHAQGLAIDINPFFNPLRFKKDTVSLQNRPLGASYHPEVPGTLFDDHPVVIKFKKLGFQWGRNFHKKLDDHHFEK